MRWIVLLTLLAGCSEVVTVTADAPPNAAPLAPPPVYADWWQEVQRDAGRVNKRFPDRWFVVPGGSWHSEYEPADARTFGSWYPDGRIFLAAGWTTDEGLVKHEMLHALLNGDREHTHRLFRVYQRGATLP